MTEHLDDQSKIDLMLFLINNFSIDYIFYFGVEIIFSRIELRIHNPHFSPNTLHKKSTEKDDLRFFHPNEFDFQTVIRSLFLPNSGSRSFPKSCNTS
jgi:hypothetical protein